MNLGGFGVDLEWIFGGWLNRRRRQKDDFWRVRKSHSGGVEVSFGRCGSLIREMRKSHAPGVDFHGFHGFPWISIDFYMMSRNT